MSYRPNFRSLGPRFGKRMKEVGAFIGALNPAQIAALQSGEVLDVADGQISMDDIDVQRQEKEGVVVAIDNNLGVGLDVQLDEELISECTAREFVNRVQNMRKDAGLDVADRIRIGVVGQPELESAVVLHRDYIALETLALEVDTGSLPMAHVVEQEWQVNNYAGTIAIARAHN